MDCRKNSNTTVQKYFVACISSAFKCNLSKVKMYQEQHIVKVQTVKVVIMQNNNIIKEQLLMHSLI